MIRVEGIHLGKTIGKLREAGGMSRKELAESAGISESHLKKIEAGTRQPGIQTYERMISILGVDIVIRGEIKTVKGKCAEKAQRIFMDSTENQALFMIHMLECMAESLAVMRQ